jgi:D-3-phosphoglycerate dehydrogenase
VTLGRCVVVVPPEGGSYAFDGDRYRGIADSILAPHVEVHHVGWAVGSSEREPWEAILKGADAVVVAPWLPLIDPPSFEDFNVDEADLKVIAGTFDFRLGWIDLADAIRRSIVVVDTSRAMTPTVAEFGVAITLALLRDIPTSIDVVRGGGWVTAPIEGGRHVFRDLGDCRVGLAGYGSINRHYRRFVRPFGCEVAIYDPFVSDDLAEADEVVRASSLRELARTSDILVVAIPPTPTTLGVVDAAAIDALVPGSLFVLLSRMAVVDQDALWRRLRAGELWAALDVFDPEPPPPDAWFRRAPNVLPTPHIAGNAAYAHERCFREACADALRVLRGEAPHHPATPRDRDLYEGRIVPPAIRDP